MTASSRNCALLEFNFIISQNKYGNTEESDIKKCIILFKIPTLEMILQIYIKNASDYSFRWILEIFVHEKLQLIIVIFFSLKIQTEYFGHNIFSIIREIINIRVIIILIANMNNLTGLFSISSKIFRHFTSDMFSLNLFPSH